MLRRSLPSLAALVLTLGPAAVRAETTRTVLVDCTRGQSINAALARNADRLIVEITGKCNEAVVVRRSGVVLRGADPAQDGIVGPVGDFVPLLQIEGAAVALRDGAAVEITRLSISGGSDCGLWVADSSVRVNDSLIADNDTGGGCSGMHVARGSSAVITRTTFLRNGLFANASSVTCRDCTFAGSPGSSFIVRDGFGSLAGSVIDGGGGASAQLGGELHVLDSTITALGRAVNVEQAQARVIDSTLSGQIVGSHRSLVRIEGTTQLANPFGNHLDLGSFLAVTASTLPGTTRLDRFSEASFADATALGDLVCTTGANAVCDGGVTKASSSCALCP